MSLDDVAAVAADDDFDLTAALAAEFDKAEGGEPAAAEPVEQVSPEPEEGAGDRARDDKGRFAPKAEPKAEAKAAEPAKAEAQPTTKAAEPPAGEPAAPVQSDAAASSGPPPGWSPSAKVAFNELPADHPIRQAVAQREVEINKGFAKLAEYKPIERYAEMAKQSGTTLDRALENYIGIENELRRDFLGGISQLCRRQGVDPVQLAQTIIARTGGAPSQPGAAGGTPSHQTAPGVDLSPLTQKISALESYIQQQQQSGVQSEIQRFASDPKNVFFDNVKAEMGRLIESGFATDLSDAYDKACWANAEIRSLLIKQQSASVSDASAKAAAAAQARQASKSVTGTPVPGAAGRQPSTSIEDEIRALMDAAV